MAVVGTSGSLKTASCAVNALVHGALTLVLTTLTWQARARLRPATPVVIVTGITLVIARAALRTGDIGGKSPALTILARAATRQLVVLARLAASAGCVRRVCFAFVRTCAAIDALPRAASAAAVVLLSHRTVVVAFFAPKLTELVLICATSARRAGTDACLALV